MRLLRSTSLEFHEYNDDVPPYMILSHTWGADEVSYQELRYLQKLQRLPDNLRQSPDFTAALEAAAGFDFGRGRATSITDRAGYQKIVHAARIAKEKGCDYVWIDACCIDKSSSAELQEAINSMYRWYQRSQMCIAYLDDIKLVVPPSNRIQEFSQSIKLSRWMTRGWTLQELIAPPRVAFFDAFWTYVCLKTDVLSELRLVTKIPEYVLATGDLQFASVAQKMSWAAARSTTRVEDQAYCLLGLFDVQMPMLYGEGEKAFLRLQEQIVRVTSDDSIFSWEPVGSSATTYRGPFARSPREFKDCTHVSSGLGRFELSNLGLRLTLPLTSYIGPDEIQYIAVPLEARRFNYGNTESSRIYIFLRNLHNNPVPPLDAPYVVKGARIFPKPEVADLNQTPTKTMIVYAEIQPTLPLGFTTPKVKYFHIVRSPTLGDQPLSKIVGAHPEENWNPRAKTLLTLAPHYEDFIGVVEVVPVLRTHRSEREGHWARAGCHLMVGFDRTWGAWCKTLPTSVLGQLDDRILWPKIARSEEYDKIRPYHSDMPPVEAASLQSVARQRPRTVGVTLSYGLVRDEVSAIVKVEGLIDV